MPQWADVVICVIKYVTSFFILALVLRFILVTIANQVGRDSLGSFVGAIHDFVTGATEPLVAPLSQRWPDVALTWDFWSLVVLVIIGFIGGVLVGVLRVVFWVNDLLSVL